ncbi:MAG TPA: hypothetical protein VK142_12140 [Bacillota bacterium]|nr:hypothetical protein [Bacillota bacterium]
MSDFLRKGFLLGLGAAVSGKEKLESKLADLVERNELTKEQAKTVLDNFIEKGAMKKDEWKESQQQKTQDIANDLGVATGEDVDALKARIAELESKLENN